MGLEEVDQGPQAPEIATDSNVQAMAGLGEVQKPDWTVGSNSYGRGPFRRNEIFVVDANGDSHLMLSGVRDKHVEHHKQAYQEEINAGTFGIDFSNRMGGPKK